MCSKFARPYLLIECPDILHFRKEEFSYGYSKVTDEKYLFNVRKQLVQLMAQFPKLNLIWSTSYMHTVKCFVELKKNQENADLAKFKPQCEDN
jgi:ERCC4-type nuclease